MDRRELLMGAASMAFPSLPNLLMEETLEELQARCARMLGLDVRYIDMITMLHLDGEGDSSTFIHFWHRDGLFKTHCCCGKRDEYRCRPGLTGYEVLVCDECDIPYFTYWKAIPEGRWGTHRLDMGKATAQRYFDEYIKLGWEMSAKLELLRAAKRLSPHG